MVIEKFLAISMIALGLAVKRQAAAATIVQDSTGGERGARRRVRWLRQNMGRRPGTRRNASAPADLRDPESVG